MKRPWKVFMAWPHSHSHESMVWAASCSTRDSARRRARELVAVGKARIANVEFYGEPADDPRTDAQRVSDHVGYGRGSS